MLSGHFSLSAAFAADLPKWPSMQGVLENLPTDPASIFVLLLLAASAGWVAWGSRKKKGPGSRGKRS